MAITNIYSAMNIGKLAIMSQQAAIQVTGHNIANVNTEGYTRQKAVLEAGHPIPTIPGDIGTGVRVTEIQRAYDRFLSEQITTEASLLGKWNMKEEMLTRVEVVFNDTVGGGLNKYMSDFFNSWEELSVNPMNDALRQTVIGKGQTLSNAFNKLSEDLNRLILDVDEKVSDNVDEINTLTVKLAELNKSIHESEINHENANDLRDTRERLVGNLSELIDIQYYEQSNTQILVSTVNGRPLVVGQDSFELAAQTSESDASIHNVAWRDIGGGLTNISSEISNGELAGLLDVRDNKIRGYLDKLNSLAAELIRGLNSVHVAGYGLDGSTGNNFFNTLTVTSKVYTTNTGSGTIGTAAIADPQNISTDRFELNFTSSGSFILNNLTTGVSSGTYTFSSNSIISALQQRGINFSISGVPASGDKFLVSVSEGAASRIGISQTIILDSKKIAASKVNSPGDGSNSLEIADINRSRIMGREGGASGTFTFDDFYSGIVGSVGNDTQTAKDNVKLREAVKLQVENRRQQVSGVSLDEEMVNLIKFQHAYGAAGKLISTVNELLTDLLNIAR